MGGDQDNTGKGIGISNELNFTASGELDNGFTWKYHTELDPAAGGATTLNDDAAIVIGMNDLGTLGIYVAEGGLSTELGFGIGAMGTGADFANTMTNIGRGYDVSMIFPCILHNTSRFNTFRCRASSRIRSKYS